MRGNFKYHKTASSTEHMENLSKESLLAIKEIVETTVKDEVRTSTDLLRQEIRAAKTELRQEMREMDNRIMGAISDVYDGLLRPRFDNHERRITKLETKIA